MPLATIRVQGPASILALITDGYGIPGGIAKFNRDLLAALARYPSVRTVVALARHGQAARNPARVIEPTGGKLGYLFRALAETHRLKPDLIVCGHINLMPVAAVCSRAAGAPSILVIHGIDAWKRHAGILTRKAVRGIDALVSVSRLTQERFERWAALTTQPRFILPNAVDLQRFRPAPADESLVAKHGLKGRRVLLTLGRLGSFERAKGIDAVLGVLPRLVKAVPNLVYFIAGEGPERDRLEAIVEKTGMSCHVVFAGWVPEEDKPAFYNLADAFALPSRGEGFGIVLIEAMASGVPVVASKTDGGREALRDGRLGILVDPDRGDDIVRGILAALARPKGVRPDGLDYFSNENFECRVHGILVAITGSEPSSK